MDTLIQKKLKFEENVANIWPDFGSNGKDLIKVHPVLNHTSGLHNALAELGAENPLLMADWDECLNRIAMSVPETEPGQQQFYHYLSFGWLCGGIIEHASGKKFQEILEEAFIRPLNIEGELYVGIPPGVESRLATLTLDTDDLNKLPERSPRPELPSTFQIDKIAQLATTVPLLFNMLNTRRAIVPAANGHCSARALARYYAALVDGGVVPPPHSSLSKPPLGSHTHIPKFSLQNSKKSNGKKSEVTAASNNKTKNHEQNIHSKDFKVGSHKRDASGDGYTRLDNGYNNIITIYDDNASKIFDNPRIHDAFLGVGEYGNLALPNGQFGLGFKRYTAEDGSFIGFGHSGMGGSTGFCDIKNRFAIVVTLNKMSFGTVAAKIIELVCSELNIPQPVEYSSVQDLQKPLIN
ncbi:hypothetical protein Patl1_12732 [Pistacia atlantica]|uniref:Uncharacterized protein n=1 Tax=Pistacia atlantica TaxID=434234 RepID=A0ACC1AY47_9ROSI|nr:hypothetical protein Patl1_12732 [Pistacia atlantica]